MKKIFFSIVALAALAACSKSEVAYEAPKEIGFTPVKGNVTKAEGLSGTLAETQKLGVWAFWNKAVEVEDDGTVSPSDYAEYSDNYLVNALFQNKTVNSVPAWGGAGNGYPWPVNGALVFAGYTTPSAAVIALDDNIDETTVTEVSYNLTEDKMIFKNYENTTEFDLCWFGRTDEAYNNYKGTNSAIPVTLSHALTWISIQVQASGAPVGWKITSMSLAGVTTKGTATCIGTTATWSSSVTDNLDIYTPEISDQHVLTSSPEKLTDNILIPRQPVQLTVNYSFMVNSVEKTDSKTVSLKLNDANTNNWANGVHYTYTLLFEGNEILVNPSRENWATPDSAIPAIPVE